MIWAYEQIIRSTVHFLLHPLEYPFIVETGVNDSDDQTVRISYCEDWVGIHAAVSRTDASPCSGI